MRLSSCSSIKTSIIAYIDYSNFYKFFDVISLQEFFEIFLTKKDQDFNLLPDKTYYQKNLTENLYPLAKHGQPRRLLQKIKPKQIRLYKTKFNKHRIPLERSYNKDRLAA